MVLFRRLTHFRRAQDARELTKYMYTAGVFAIIHEGLTGTYITVVAGS